MTEQLKPRSARQEIDKVFRQAFTRDSTTDDDPRRSEREQLQNELAEAAKSEPSLRTELAELQSRARDLRDRLNRPGLDDAGTELHEYRASRARTKVLRGRLDQINQLRNKLMQDHMLSPDQRRRLRQVEHERPSNRVFHAARQDLSSLEGLRARREAEGAADERVAPTSDEIADLDHRIDAARNRLDALKKQAESVGEQAASIRREQVIA